MGYPDQDGSLHFGALREKNVMRVLLWHGAKGVDHWTVADWAVAAAGEMGELCNAVKKLTRHDTGVKAKGDDLSRLALLDNIAFEAADVVIYLDLLMTKIGRDLGEAVQLKFNFVSDREGFNVKL